MSDSLNLLHRALDQAADVIGGVEPAQASLPTPCAEWDVRALVGHMIGGLDNFITRAEGRNPDWSASRPDPGPDWVGTFTTKAAALRDAWRAAGDLDGTIELAGMGEVPATFPVDQQVTELAVHTWDLARATGQDVRLDPEIAEHALAWSSQAMRPEFRGPGTAFGVEQEAPPDAPAPDRLAAFAGRSTTPAM